jgi:hypothetical protein
MPKDWHQVLDKQLSKKRIKMSKPKAYKIDMDGESLEARLIMNGREMIQLVYVNEEGDRLVGLYRDGMQLRTTATLASGKPAHSNEDTGNSWITGYYAAYDKMGPDLRKKMPKYWREILGPWLAKKD